MVPFTTFFGHGFLDAFLVPLLLPFGTLWAPHATLLASIGFLLAILAPFGALGITLPAVEPHFVSISDFGGTNLHQNVISGA